MYTDTQFLMALVNKLIEISENCIDINTQLELSDLIERITDQMQP